MGFKIRKLYLDCIDNQGNCFIIYWAKAEFFLFRFTYSGLLFCDADGLTIERSTLRKSTEPEIDGTIIFNNKFLRTGISLSRSDNPIMKLIYKDSKNNELIWDCHHPRAIAEINYNGSISKGLGYAETLLCPINPVDLPVDELRWGRFLSDSHTLIWIHWKGSYPLNNIFLNGIEYNDAIFENDSVIFNDGIYRLKFSEIQTIRNGRLSGLFSKMKFLKVFFSSRLLKTVEIKYKAKTILSGDTGFLSDGWSLFEIVTWGK
jgi:hypothetical protein